MSANPRDIPTMRMVVGSTSERYTTAGDISFGLIRYNTTDNNVEAYAKDGWVNLQGGSDASLSSIVEYTDNSGITFLSDVSVNGVLNSTDGSFSGNLYSTSGIIGGAGGWILGANGYSNYTFTGSGLTGSVSNPTLNLFRGNKYIFINNTTEHPFQISNSDNTAYGTGVTNNGGAGGSTITFEVPYDAPKTLKYICTSHAGAMNGVINIHGGGSVLDASFQNDVTIAGNLYVDGSFNFGEVIQNITTVNNELLISTQVDISNYGTGPALSVTQHGDGASDNLLLLHAGTDGSAVEVKGDGKSIFYKDVSINTQLIVPDASFNRIAPIDGSLVIMGDLSVNGQIFSSGGLVGGGGGGGSGTDASFNVIDEFLDGSGVTFLTDVSFQNDVDISGNLNVKGVIDNSLTIVGNIIIQGDISADNFSSGTPTTNVIAPVAYAKVNTDSAGSGTGMSWGAYNSSNGEMLFTFDTPLSDANYYVLAEREQYDTHSVNITNKSITGFKATWLGNDGTSALSPATFGGVLIVYASTPIIPITGGGRKSGNDGSFNVIGEFNLNSGTTFLNDVSINTQLIVPDASFNRIQPNDGSLVIMGDISVNGQIFSSGGLVGGGGGGGSGTDVSFNVIDEFLDGSGVTFLTDVSINGDFKNSGFADLSNKVFLNTVTTTFNTGTIVDLSDVVTAMSTHLVAVDASFLNDVNVKGNLYVDGSFNFSEVVKNITTVDNELLISTQVDISNYGTGPALSVTQHGDGVGDNLVLLHAGTEGTAVEVKGDGKSIFYKDVDISGKLVLYEDISINGELIYGGFADISNKVFLNTVTTTFNTGTIVDLSDVVTAMGTQLTTHDASFYRIAPIDGSLVIMGDLSVNGNIFSSGGIVGGGGGGGSGTDASFNVIDEFIDGSGVTFLTDVSFQNDVDVEGKLVVKDDVSVNVHLSVMDASFQNDITVGGNLYVDGSFNFGEVIQNITTVNNELLISTQVDISNHGTGPALSVTQYGDGDNDNLVLLHAGTDGSAVEIKGDGNSIFYKDVSINTRLIVPDASFNRIAPIDGSLVIMGDLSVNGNLKFGGDIFANNLNGTLQKITIFEDVPCTTSNGIWLDAAQSRDFVAGTVLIHDITATSSIGPGYIDWPSGGHEYILSRHDLQSGNEDFEKFKYIFDSQNVHEENRHTFVENITNSSTYTNWKLTISGDGILTDARDTLNWETIVLSPVARAASSHIENYTLFDASAGSALTTDTIWEASNSIEIPQGSMVFHDIKVSGYIGDGYVDWPLAGHEFNFYRKKGGSYTWDHSKSYEQVKHVFTSRNAHEEQTYSVLETVAETNTYSQWKCDFSGSGGLTDTNDKLTWKMTVITPGDYNIRNNYERIKRLEIFNAVGSSAGNPYPPYWHAQQTHTVAPGTIMIHTIKVASRIQSGFVSWPDGGHQYNIYRVDNSGNGYGDPIETFKYIFDGREDLEEASYTFTEIIDNTSTFIDWKIDVSGEGVVNDTSNILSWDVALITPKLLTAAPASLMTTHNVFDNVSYDGASSWDISSNPVINVPKGSIVLHDIKVSGKIATGYVDWPLSGHEFIFQRRYNGDNGYYTWDDGTKTYEHAKHIFTGQGVHEEQDYTMIEKHTTQNRDFTRWKCDLSGNGAALDSDDTLNWTVTVITPSEFNHLNDICYGQVVPATMLTGTIPAGRIPGDLDTYVQTGSLGGSMPQDIYGEKRFKDDVDISGKLVVKDDVSFNAHLSAMDASFQNNVDISGKLVVDGGLQLPSGTTSQRDSNSNIGSIFYNTDTSNVEVYCDVSQNNTDWKNIIVNNRLIMEFYHTDDGDSLTQSLTTTNVYLMFRNKMIKQGDERGFSCLQDDTNENYISKFQNISGFRKTFFFRFFTCRSGAANVSLEFKAFSNTSSTEAANNTGRNYNDVIDLVDGNSGNINFIFIDNDQNLGGGRLCWSGVVDVDTGNYLHILVRTGSGAQIIGSTVNTRLDLYSQLYLYEL